MTDYISKYEVVVERMPDSFPTDFQIRISGPAGLVSIPAKYLDRDQAEVLVENIRYAFEAGMREACRSFGAFLYRSTAIIDTKFPKEWGR